MKEVLVELKEWLKSDDCDKYVERINNQKAIVDMQLLRLYNSNRFIDFTECVINKYADSTYIDKWYKRGIEPPEYLLWFIFEYAEKYGRECTDTEIEKYANTFTTKLIYCDGYYFNRMDGQGSFIKVIKV